MKFIKCLVIIIVILVAVFFVGGMLLSKEVNIARSIEINKPDSLVYARVADLNLFSQWNTWSLMEPTASFKVSGETGKPGSTFEWSGKKIGSGKLTITNATPNKHIDEDLTFLTPMQGKYSTPFDFEPTPNGGTKVTWGMKGEVNSTFDKWMMLVMSGSLKKDYDKGLTNLKLLCEK